MKTIPRYRITVDVDEELYFDIVNLYPWGMRNKILKEILQQSTDIVKLAGDSLRRAVG
jgi:hypothetical protein